MKFLRFTALALGLLTGCKDNPPPAPTTPTPTYTTAVEVTVDNAPPYDLLQAYVSASNYDQRLASLQIVGKLYNNRELRLSFQQSTPTVGANITDAVTATLDGVRASQASGQTQRDPTNSVSGTFDCTFPNGTTVSGRLRGVKLR
ncbi:hypothetical protein [Hymenobacter coalescens]